MKTTELTRIIAERIEALATLTDDARKSQAMQMYLATLAKFHAYSFGNQILIAFQRPDATRIAGRKAWEAKFNRRVRDDQRYKGIAILAPWYKSVEDENGDERRQLRFRQVFVYDVSQTEGEPLPAEPEWKSLEQHPELAERLIGYARELGVGFTVEDIHAQGLSHSGSIVVRPDAGTKTIIHELAHEVLHGPAERMVMSRDAMELEAESVAFVVATHFQIGGLNSPNYLALWSADAAKIRQCMERIGHAAKQIIVALGGDDTQGKAGQNNLPVTRPGS